MCPQINGVKANCGSCGIELLRTHKQSQTPKCFDCKREYNRIYTLKYYQENKEKYRAYRKAYRLKVKEEKETNVR